MAAQYTDSVGDTWVVDEEARFGPATNFRPGDQLPEPTTAVLVFQRVRDGSRRIASNAPLDWRGPEVLAWLFASARER